MPHIDSVSRALADGKLRDNGIDAVPDSSGMLAYMVTKLTLSFIRQKKNFMTMALAIGVLICVVLEIYRKWLGPYETNKAYENGDAFNPLVK